MGLPVLVAVDGDADALAVVEAELDDRYGRHYRIVCCGSASEAIAELHAAAEAGDDVALVLAAQQLADMGGRDLLGEVRRSHPQARRALLVAWGNWGHPATASAIFDGVAHGQLDHFVLRPSGSPDELFHQSISTMLLDWAENRRAAPYTVHIVGDSWSGRAYELREALQQCAIPHHFCLADSSEGSALIEAAGHPAELPIMVFPNGHVLVNPSNPEIALASGSPVSPGDDHYDLVVVGAGPAGLSAAVYGASEGLHTLVVDRGGIGGQATSSSLIRNYLGFSAGISGRRLAREAYDQAWVFGAQFTFMQTVTGVTRDGDEVVVTLSDFGPVRARTVVLAMGASYRRIDVPELEALSGAGVYYGGPTSEAPALAGDDVFVVGGANSAGQAALHLARWARKVVLVVRAATLRAGMSEYLVRQVEATDNIELRLGTEVVGGGGEGHLERLVLRDRGDGEEQAVAAQALFLLIGAQPHTDWLPAEVCRDAQGFVLTGPDLPTSAWPLERRPFAFETSVPGVLAVGDVRHGSVKRVASAVGEGSIAVQLVHQLLAAEGHRPRGRPAADLGAPA